jgi:hypothetical protein
METMIVLVDGLEESLVSCKEQGRPKSLTSFTCSIFSTGIGFKEGVMKVWPVEYYFFGLTKIDDHFVDNRPCLNVFKFLRKRNFSIFRYEQIGIICIFK